MGGLGRIACKGPVSGGLKWGEEEQTRGGGHAAVIDCFVGTISVAQLDARADGFNYFRLNLNGASGVWKKGAARLGVKGLCCHLPQPPNTRSHKRTVLNPAVSHGADGLWSRLSRQRKSPSHTSQAIYSSHTPLTAHVPVLHMGRSGWCRPCFSPSGETHLAHIHSR